MDPDKRTPASAKTPAAKGRRMSKSATPAGSRASSVTSTTKKKSGRTPGAKKAKLKGHNPDYNAAYHYGSDFEGEEEYEENENDKSSESEESEADEESNDMKPENKAKTSRKQKNPSLKKGSSYKAAKNCSIAKTRKKLHKSKQSLQKTVRTVASNASSGFGDLKKVRFRTFLQFFCGIL